MKYLTILILLTGCQAPKIDEMEPQERKSLIYCNGVPSNIRDCVNHDGVVDVEEWK